MATLTTETPIVLRSSRLAVEVAVPGSVYSGTRFDWTAFVTQVTLDGAHTFCVPESLEAGQGTGGIGLCGEFGIDRPIGYDDAQPGDLFPKLGIGLLERTDAPRYSFMQPYPIAQRFPIQVDAGESQVRFVVEPLECRGYAARLTKTVAVRENWLEIGVQLDNVGSKEIETNEYVHNFLGIDGHLLGPDYRLRFPYPVQLQELPHMPRQEILDVAGRDLTLGSTPQRPFYCRPLGFFQTEDAQWELLHLPSGVGLREVDDFAPCRVAVWGTAHVISAEIFVEVSLAPGETQRWQRHYLFFA